MIIFINVVACFVFFTIKWLVVWNIKCKKEELFLKAQSTVEDVLSLQWYKTEKNPHIWDAATRDLWYCLRENNWKDEWIIKIVFVRNSLEILFIILV